MGTNHISGTAEATVVKFCTQVGYWLYQVPEYGGQIIFKIGVVRVT